MVTFMKCVVGLGNPGRKYARTRHNVGFMVADRISEMLDFRFSEYGFNNVASGIISNKLQQYDLSKPIKVLLAKPAVYMNRSGIAISDLLADHPTLIQNILVIHDDMDLDFGKIRFKRKGSSGGHKGVQSIIDFLNDNNFPRLKVGVGRPDPYTNPADHVLGEFDNKDLLSSVIEAAADASIVSLAFGIEEAMNRYHGNLIFGETEVK